MMDAELIAKCQKLLTAYQQGQLGYSVMPEDSSPAFTVDQSEQRLVYFTLPMSLNYQRDSYKLWQAALATYNDPTTHSVFSIANSATLSQISLRQLLLKHKVALQPNKHIATWQTISQTVSSEWGTLSNLFDSVDNDFLQLRDTVQGSHKKGFPYLSGPKIFNYWSFIISTYGQINLKNRQYIDIAPDTHITKCSVILGVITQAEALMLSKDEVSKRWRAALRGSAIVPIDMHPPLWFWSRNGFKYQLE